MLSPEMIEKLNQQINMEHDAHNLYLAMCSWCRFKGYDGAAEFFYLHSKEEMEHMIKLFDYVTETGGLAIVDALPKPPSEFNSLKDVFEQTFAHEQKVTRSINKLVGFATEQNDYSTLNFLQWYVAEQHEEEALFMGILDKINLIGTEGMGLYMIDRELKDLARLHAQPGESAE